jgi:hypothetical protein
VRTTMESMSYGYTTSHTSTLRSHYLVRDAGDRIACCELKFRTNPLGHDALAVMSGHVELCRAPREGHEALRSSDCGKSAGGRGA